MINKFEEMKVKETNSVVSRKVKVTNLNNNKSVVVKINDRGPFKPGRIIDLSKKANQMISCNLCKVDLKVLSRGDGAYKKR